MTDRCHHHFERRFCAGCAPLIITRERYALMILGLYLFGGMAALFAAAALQYFAFRDKGGGFNAS